VGQSVDYLVFANDHDKGTKDGKVVYSNVMLQDPPDIGVSRQMITPRPSEQEAQVVVNVGPSSTAAGNQFNASSATTSETVGQVWLDLSDFRSWGEKQQDGDGGGGQIEDDGATLHLTGNHWKALRLSEPFTITREAMLEFDFEGIHEAEIAGIGFDTNLDFNPQQDSSSFFQVWGTQRNYGNQDYHDYSLPTRKRYVINFADHSELLGRKFSYLVLADDADHGTQTGEVRYGHVTLTERSLETETVDRVFTFGDSDDVITISDDGIPGNGISRITSLTNGDVDFVNPSGLLHIVTAGGDDRVTIESLDSKFVAELVVEGDLGDDLLDARGLNHAVTFLGGLGNDTLAGGNAADRLLGDRGNDLIAGFGGDDFINGAADEDSLLGGDGDDVIFGGGGRDVLTGDSGDDSLKGQGGDDTLSGGPGVDNLIGQESELDEAFSIDFDELIDSLG